MNKARSAGTRALLLGLAAAAVAAGSATAALPAPKIRVHARLAPSAGTAATAGSFDGVLARTGNGAQQSALPRVGLRWQLVWKVSLPAPHAPATVSLRINAGGGVAPVVRELCTGCGDGSSGRITLTPNQVFRIARWGAVVTVRTRSGRLRGTVRVLYVAKPG